MIIRDKLKSLGISVYHSTNQDHPVLQVETLAFICTSSFFQIVWNGLMTQLFVFLTPLSLCV
jgi:hypothetical protein